MRPEPLSWSASSRAHPSRTTPPCRVYQAEGQSGRLYPCMAVPEFEYAVKMEGGSPSRVHGWSGTLKGGTGYLSHYFAICQLPPVLMPSSVRRQDGPRATGQRYKTFPQTGGLSSWPGSMVRAPSWAPACRLFPLGRGAVGCIGPRRRYRWGRIPELGNEKEGKTPKLEMGLWAPMYDHDKSGSDRDSRTLQCVTDWKALIIFTWRNRLDDAR